MLAFFCTIGGRLLRSVRHFVGFHNNWNRLHSLYTRKRHSKVFNFLGRSRLASQCSVQTLFFNRSQELFGLRAVLETAFVFAVIYLYILSYMHNMHTIGKLLMSSRICENIFGFYFLFSKFFFIDAWSLEISKVRSVHLTSQTWAKELLYILDLGKSI